MTPFQQFNWTAFAAAACLVFFALFALSLCTGMDNSARIERLEADH